MKKAGIILMASVLFHAAAHAAPVYLNCVFTSKDGEPWPVQITADEEARSVSLFMPKTGLSQHLSATFTPDKLLFHDDMIAYAIHRITLVAARVTPIIDTTEDGTCEVKEAPKRAF